MRWKWDQAEPFGVTTPDENPTALGAFELPLRFSGQYADKETGISYNYFRDYDSNTGRYIQSDPIGLKGGLATYSYGEGRPISKFDSKGLFSGEFITGAGDVPPMPVLPDDTRLADCFFSCVEKHYGIVDVTLRVGVGGGALPIYKPGIGVPVVGGASPYTNALSYYGPSGKIGTQILGTNRIAGLLGRLNLVLGVGLLAYDLTSIGLCVDECMRCP